MYVDAGELEEDGLVEGVGVPWDVRGVVELERVVERPREGSGVPAYEGLQVGSEVADPDEG